MHRDGEWTPEEVEQALAGDESVLTRMVDALTPVIQARVARRLLLSRQGAAAGRNVRQEVEDLTQEIFRILFEDGGKVLRSWVPKRGLTLLNFAGLVAERQTVSILRSGKRSPWKEDPTLPDELDTPAKTSDPETVAASRETLRLLVQRLTEELSPLGRHLFDLMFLEDRPVREVSGRTGMSSDAVYAWRSRLRRLARQILDDLSETAATPRTSSTDGRA